MKFNFSLKGIPLISTLILIFILGISNQKENTKLRILIWNTPTLPLGSYIAISTGTGFLLSYFITISLAKINSVNKNESLKYKQNDKPEEPIDYTNANSLYDNTLIERDIKDPSPTINANFRIIGTTDRIKTNYINNNNTNNLQYDESYEFDSQYDEQLDENENFNPINQVKSISSDWNDESYSNW